MCREWEIGGVWFLPAEGAGGLAGAMVEVVSAEGVRILCLFPGEPFASGGRVVGGLHRCCLRWLLLLEMIFP